MISFKYNYFKFFFWSSWLLFRGGRFLLFFFRHFVILASVSLGWGVVGSLFFYMWFLVVLPLVFLFVYFVLVFHHSFWSFGCCFFGAVGGEASLICLHVAVSFWFWFLYLFMLYLVSSFILLFWFGCFFGVVGGWVLLCGFMLLLFSFSCFLVYPFCN